MNDDWRLATRAFLCIVLLMAAALVALAAWQIGARLIQPRPYSDPSTQGET